MIHGTLIILVALMAGEALSSHFGLSLPGNVAGMVVMFLLLRLQIVEPNTVEGVAGGLIRNLGLLFVPIVALAPLHFELLSDQWMLLIGATVISLPITLVVTGWVVQLLLTVKSDG